MSAPRVLIFGGSSGIGRAAALRFAGQGAHLMLVSRSPEALDAAARECKEAGAADVDWLTADVLDADRVEAAVDAAVSRFGVLDATVHSAAVMAYGTIEALPAPVFERVVDTSIHGTANVCRAVLACYRRQGRGSLIVVSSLLASVAAPTMGAYVVGKWGQLGLMRTLQMETRDEPGIDISVICPGGVSTPIYYEGATYSGTTGTPPPPVYSSDRVARDIVARVEHPRRQSQSGLFNHAIIAGFRLVPALYDLLVGPLVRRLGYAGDGAAPNPGNVFEPRPQLESATGPWWGI